jgi:site-specific DNA-methyltransferase (adenine-specific)
MNIFNDDCFNIFPKLEENSIDLFILDLPYANKKFGNCTACDWDTPIDLERMWIEIKRIMKPNTIIVFLCNTKFGYALINSNPKWFKYDLVWEKTKLVGFLLANKQPLRKHENIYIFKKEQGTYNPQKTIGKPYKGFESQNGKKIGEIYGGKSLHNENKGDRHPTSILKFNSVGKGTIHPTQKPVELIEWLIKSYSNEGDLVMDFTMGSGTTGVACINTNRNFIGIERDTEIFKLAKNRLY